MGRYGSHWDIMFGLTSAVSFILFEVVEELAHRAPLMITPADACCMLLLLGLAEYTLRQATVPAEQTVYLT
jgi:hypothetical protein